eukprot:6195982-Pleurochrysis_carterae.AAC.1
MAARAVLGCPVLFKCVRLLLSFRVSTRATGFVVLILVCAFALCKECAARFARVEHPMLASVQLREYIANGGERGCKATGSRCQGYLHVEQGAYVFADATNDVGQFLGHDTFRR